MKENTKKGVTRREFLGLSALGLASLTILPSWAVNGVRIAPSDRVVLGFVGLGQQGLSDFKSFSTCPGVQVAACCDVDSLKRERFKRRVEAWQKSLNVAPRCDMYEFYEDVLDRKDIDVIEVATLACIGCYPCLSERQGCLLSEAVGLYDYGRFGCRSCRTR